MAPDFPHSIFDPLSCTGTQWIVDKVMIKHSLHSVLICDIHTARFLLDCSQAAVCPCTLFRVCCRPHSEGCDYRNHRLIQYKNVFFFQQCFGFLCNVEAPKCIVHSAYLQNLVLMKRILQSNLILSFKKSFS